MRLSEKTLEINICAQINEISDQRIIWFGLTQKQEAQAGFDVYSRMGGRLIIFQFKASNQIIRGMRRFNAKHKQMENLRKQCSCILNKMRGEEHFRERHFGKLSAGSSTS